MFRRWAMVVGAFCIASCCVTSVSAVVQYSVADLGALSGLSGSFAYGINNSGQVVGMAFFAGNSVHAFLWTSSGGMHDLGTLGNSQGYASAINNSGQITGYTLNGSPSHAFLWTSAGGMLDLGTFGGRSSGAYGINDSGQVVGGAYNSSGYGRAFLWSSIAGMQDLGTLGGAESWAFDINSSGQVVGGADLSGGSEQAFLWTIGGGMQGLGGGLGWANAINNHEQIVGQSSGNAFLWTNGSGVQGLGTLGGSGSVAYDINDSGQIVGAAKNSQGIDHAALWSADTRSAIDLNTLISPSCGLTLLTAEAINDSGWIVGRAISPTSQQDAYLLIPLPEPSTFALGIGVIGLLAYGWRRRKST